MYEPGSKRSTAPNDVTKRTPSHDDPAVSFLLVGEVVEHVLGEFIELRVVERRTLALTAFIADIERPGTVGSDVADRCLVSGGGRHRRRVGAPSARRTGHGECGYGHGASMTLSGHVGS